MANKLLPRLSAILLVTLITACGDANLALQDDPTHGDRALVEAMALTVIPRRMDEGMSGGGSIPFVQSVKSIQLCVAAGTCATPVNFTSQGGSVYDGYDHRMFQLFGTLGANENYLADMRTAFRFAFESVQTPSGFVLVRTQCETSMFFFDCMDVFARYATFNGTLPASRIVNVSMCIKKDAEAWETPDCNPPVPVRGGVVSRITAAGYDQCIGDDSNANPHCYNIFVERR